MLAKEEGGPENGALPSGEQRTMVPGMPGSTARHRNRCDRLP
jgi:hypothetical protein